MGKVQKLIAAIILLLLPVGAFQNCADFMMPEHDGGGFDLSSYNSTGFGNTLKPLLTTNCGACHGGVQDPLFAVANDASAIEVLVTAGLVNTSVPANSEIVLKISGGHSGIPTSLAAQLQTAIAAWSAGMIAAP